MFEPRNIMVIIAFKAMERSVLGNIQQNSQRMVAESFSASPYELLLQRKQVCIPRCHNQWRQSREPRTCPISQMEAIITSIGKTVHTWKCDSIRFLMHTL